MRYTWDSLSLGWQGDEHLRLAMIIVDGKIAYSEKLVDGKFCICEYRHGWPTLACCVEAWAHKKAREQGL